MILTRLAKANPDCGPTLEFGSPFELLVATILAAQAQDAHINQVTRALFLKYPGPADYLRVPVDELEHRARDLILRVARQAPHRFKGLIEKFGHAHRIG